MGNGPMQHCVHPGRHTNHSPLFCAASASAASTIWVSRWSAAGTKDRMGSHLHLRRKFLLKLFDFWRDYHLAVGLASVVGEVLLMVIFRDEKLCCGFHRGDYRIRPDACCVQLFNGLA